MVSSISCSTSTRLVNWSRCRAAFIVSGSSDGITRVAIRFTLKPYFLLSVSITRYMSAAVGVVAR